MLTLIAAVDRMNGIGKEGKIPWYEPRDLSFFRKETKGSVVIMGRNTWDSLTEPLKDRYNIVVSSTYGTRSNTDTLFHTDDLETALMKARTISTRIYGIGGQQIYEELLPVCNRILLTKIPGDYDCDTFFPVPGKRDLYSYNSYFIDDMVIEEYLRKFS